MASATGRKRSRKHPAKAAGRKPAARKGRKPARSTKPPPARSIPLDLEIDADVLEFIEAIDRFRHDHARPFPSWSEVLHVLRQLGYEKS